MIMWHQNGVKRCSELYGHKQLLPNDRNKTIYTKILMVMLKNSLALWTMMKEKEKDHYLYQKTD